MGRSAHLFFVENIIANIAKNPIKHNAPIHNMEDFSGTAQNVCDRSKGSRMSFLFLSRLFLDI